MPKSNVDRMNEVRVELAGYYLSDREGKGALFYQLGIILAVFASPIMLMTGYGPLVPLFFIVGFYFFVAMYKEELFLSVINIAKRDSTSDDVVGTRILDIENKLKKYELGPAFRDGYLKLYFKARAVWYLGSFSASLLLIHFADQHPELLNIVSLSIGSYVLALLMKVIISESIENQAYSRVKKVIYKPGV